MAQEIIGQPAPHFALPDTQGQLHRLSDYRGQVVVLAFWSAECPVSREYDAYFNRLADRYPGQVVVLGVDANVNEQMEAIVKAQRERGVRFPILRDADCALADELDAATTPHVFIVDRAGRLAYAGAVDDRTFRQREATVNYVDQAVEALLNNAPPPVSHTQPYGCTIVRFGMEH